jgi:citrate lyase subunit beta/citryl-CoA lyase
MKPLRSLLFVPADKPDWVEKALRAGPDGIILDMEDSVVQEKKVSTRSIVRETLEEWKGRNIFITVRVNGFESGLTFDDLESIVCPGLSDVSLPKVETERDMIELDILLRHFERRARIPEARISTTLMLETAPAMLNAYQICRSSPRIKRASLAAGAEGDAQRAVGYKWTRESKETLYLRSKIVLDAKAAGVHPMIASWFDIKDLEGYERDCNLNRQLGFRGAILIHPSQVEIANRIFSPSKEEVIYYKNLLKAYEKAEKKGEGASVYEGRLVDYAIVKSAREILDFAKSIGMDV